jgi:hypothetical protein
MGLEFFSDPKVVGPVVAVFAAIIAAFYRGNIITGAAHAKLEINYEKRITDLVTAYERRLADKEAEKNEYKSMVLSLLDVTDRSLTAKGAPAPGK